MSTAWIPVLTNYQIVRAVGTGGMSTVYEAVDLRLKRPVAIKVMHPQLGADPRALERFRREALAARSVNHPNIVSIYDYILSGTAACIVMEYVAGPDLGSAVKERGPLTFETVRFIMAQVAAALDEAHSRGILHRDVKPSNILLREDSRVLLTDFGLARRQFDSRLTQRDAVAGTLLFMSPEQIRNNPLGPATDIYSWAVTFLYCLTGHLPYAHQKFPEVIADIQNGRVVVDGDIRERVPQSYVSLLERCLVPDPEKRIRDGTELRHVLLACGEISTVDLSPLCGVVRREAVGPSSGEITVSQFYRKRHGVVWRTVSWVLGALGVLAVLFYAAFWYLQHFRSVPGATMTAPYEAASGEKRK